MEDEPHLIVVSARDEDRLRAQAENLRRFFSDASEGLPRLGDVAYTLQVGRDEMESRLAFVARDRRGALETLERFLGGKTEGVYQGRMRGHREDLLGQGPALDQFLNSLIAAGDWSQIARLWVEGVQIPWGRLSVPAGRRRVSLRPILLRRFVTGCRSNLRRTSGPPRTGSRHFIPCWIATNRRLRAEVRRRR